MELAASLFGTCFGVHKHLSTQPSVVRP